MGLGTVHPRMGGEQPDRDVDIDGTVGSSPHGRGTEKPIPSYSHNIRFIPAWAGNRPGDIGFVIVAGVHPRMGGEQVEQGARQIEQGGSSPHGRGTGQLQKPRRITGRFIPAWAGNRQWFFVRPIPAPVHPRMGGEQFVS